MTFALASFHELSVDADPPAAVAVSAARTPAPPPAGLRLPEPGEALVVGTGAKPAGPAAAGAPGAAAEPESASGAELDAADVRASIAGDARAFERIYRRHASRVYGLCWRLCGGDAARAAQAAQDAFVRAWEKLDSFRGEAAFSTWMHRLTVNVVLGEHRLLKRWTSYDDAFEPGSAHEEPSSHPQASLSDRLDLERALLKLPKGARAVLVLHDIEGWQHREIADATGIAVGTSKAQLHRARRLMREWLA